MISTSQTGTASTQLIINGLNSVAADEDGLVDNETLASPGGSFALDGAQTSSGEATNLKSTVIISSSSDNETVTFTITGKDLDGNEQIETITGVNGNSVRGTNLFTEITSISSDAATDINVGTEPAFGSTLGTRVSITSTANESDNSFTIVGIGTDGLSKTETILGPNSGKTVVSLGLFSTITSITPSSNTKGNIEIGTAPGYELIATAEGTIEGAQFKLVSSTANTANAEMFGLKEGTTSMLGNFVVQPTTSNPAIGIEITENDVKSNFTIKFDNNIPKFFNSDGSAISGSPPTSITLSWNESSGTTDEDSIYNGTHVRKVGMITNGVLSTTDDEGLLTSKSVTAGNIILDGNLKNSKALNGKITIFCDGDETSNSFEISGLILMVYLGLRQFQAQWQFNSNRYYFF